MIDSVDILIPVYKNAHLTRRCLESLIAIKGEIAEYQPRIIIINDSPDDEDVSSYLAQVVEDKSIDLLITNSRNSGFVKSVNKGLAEVRKRGAAAILVNSDTESFPGTLKEMLAVAQLDEQIAFVCPRSNNASICTFPQTPHNRSGLTADAAKCHEAWQSVSAYLPRYTFSPTAVGFYMLISNLILEDFGGLDEEFGIGYEEENDLVLRANKVGFRAVIANHAFAYHAGSASFLLQDLNLDTHKNANLSKMVARHPEFVPLVRAYEASPEFRSERALRNLVPDEQGRLNLVLNCLEMGTHFNGTNELITNIIWEMERSHSNLFNITALMNSATVKAFDFDSLKNIRISNSITDEYAVAVAFGQPYDLHSLNVMEVLAPINVFGMLDAISWDCGYLRVQQKVDDLWATTALHSNGLFFISEFGKETFHHRFKIGTATRSFTRLLPTRLSSYEKRYADAKSSQSHVFIAGNHYRHKASTRCADDLAKAFPSLHFLAMAEAGAAGKNVTRLKSGELSDSDMIHAIAGSSVVVLPSYYEGFGFSIMHALALGKPVVARDIPATREILATFKSTEGVFLFATNKQLPEVLTRALATRASSVDDSGAPDWASWTEGFLDFLKDLANPAVVHDVLVNRITERDRLRKMEVLEKSVARLEAGGTTTLTGQFGAEAMLSPSRDTGGKYALDELKRMADDEFIQFLYAGILGRKADQTGFAHHSNLLRRGTPRQTLIESILSSEEFRSSGRSVEIAGLERSFVQRLRRSFSK